MVDVFRRAPAPEALQVLKSFVPVSMNSPPPRNGQDLLKSYATSPWLHSTCGRVAEHTARIPYKLFVARNVATKKAYKHRVAQTADAASRRKVLKRMEQAGELEEVVNHPILDLLSNHNRLMVGMRADALTTIFLDLLGEAFSYKERNAMGVPIALWPLSPMWCTRVPDPGYDFFDFRINAKSFVLPRTEVVYMARPNPFDIYRRGVGQGFALQDQIASEQMISEHIKASFYNNLRPDFIIAAEGLDDPTVARLETKWLEKFRRIAARFMPHFINRQITLHKLNETNRQSQTLDLLKAMRDIIIQVYGVPPEIFGILSDSNRATITEAEYIMSRFVLDPRKDFQRSHYQEQLVVDFDERFILDYENPIDADWDFILKVAEKAPYSRSVDEWRMLQDLPVIDGNKGAVYPIEARYSFRADFEELEEPAGSELEPVEDEEPPKPEDADEDAGKTAKQRPWGGPFPYSQWGHVCKDLTDAQINSIVDAIKFSELRDELKPIMASIVADFGQGMLDDSGIELTFDKEDAKTAEFLRERSAQLVKTNKTTQKRIRAALIEGRAEGEVGYKLSKRIEHTFKIARGSRARAIARTEVGTAQNFSHNAAINQAEIPYKEWNSIMDPERTRSTHMTLNGQKVKADENFKSSSGATAPYPGAFGVAEEDINCMCVVLAAFRKDGHLSTVEKSAILKDLESKRQRYEKQMRAALRRAFDKQENAALAALKRSGA